MPSAPVSSDQDQEPAHRTTEAQSDLIVLVGALFQPKHLQEFPYNPNIFGPKAYEQRHEPQKMLSDVSRSFLHHVIAFNVFLHALLVNRLLQMGFIPNLSAHGLCFAFFALAGNC